MDPCPKTGKLSVVGIMKEDKLSILKCWHSMISRSLTTVSFKHSGLLLLCPLAFRVTGGSIPWTTNNTTARKKESSKWTGGWFTNQLPLPSYSFQTPTSNGSEHNHAQKGPEDEQFPEGYEMYNLCVAWKCHKKLIFVTEAVGLH